MEDKNTLPEQADSTQGAKYLANELQDGDKGLSDEEFKASRPKISVALTKNLWLFKNNAITLVKTNSRNKNGQEYSLGKKEMQLIFALNIYMARWGKDKQIQDYIRIISEEKHDPGFRISRWIDINELTALIYGKGTRERERDEVYERLKSLASIRMRFTCKAPEFSEDEGTYINPDAVFEDNILGSVGKTFKYRSRKEGELHIFAEVVFSFIFFQNLNKQFSPINSSILVIRDEEGKIINNSNLFWSIASLLHAERYRFITKGVSDAKKKANEDYKNVKNYGERQKLVRDAIEKGLVFKVPIQKILEITTADYTSRKRMSRKGEKGDFWEDLEKTIKALKLYGIITNGYVNKDKDMVIFIFNRKFAISQDLRLPDGKEEDNNLLEKKEDGK